ncbi:Aste57867_808 [Aphanomyces stellatus]|uniref:Aste57867_808 protein n=1 Tax=Aphanomyces stellatus TaxID=120398 RepID=A0A485K3X4_9STRA|nr:hypothetical protein As57867_000807 [Aphanomyces stellatus]VFT78032.1 Aste57867_808 [Aphanomyces stellatus]
MGHTMSRVVWSAASAFSNVLRVQPNSDSTTFRSDGRDPEPPPRRDVVAPLDSRESRATTKFVRRVLCLATMAAAVSRSKRMANQLRRRTPSASAAVQVYECRDAPQFRAVDGGLDMVRHRKIAMRLGTFERCVWGTFTTPTQSAQWRVKCLERPDANTVYMHISLCVPRGRPDDDNVFVSLQVVFHRVHQTKGRFAVTNHHVKVRVSGWIVLDRDKESTLARTLVKFRTSRWAAEIVVVNVRFPDTPMYVRQIATSSCNMSKMKRGRLLSPNGQRNVERAASGCSIGSFDRRWQTHRSQYKPNQMQRGCKGRQAANLVFRGGFHGSVCATEHATGTISATGRWKVAMIHG